MLSIPVWGQEAGVTHVVQPGENLYRIALRYGVDMNSLAQANGITNMAQIYAGQQLVIPGLAAPTEGDGAVIENPLIAGTPTTHVIQPGETLTHIANRYGITVEQLLQSNNITNPNRIRRGDTLTVWTVESVNAPLTETEASVNQDTAGTTPETVAGAPPTSDIVYVVQPGEHLAQIAQRYGLNWTTIAAVNGITNPNQLYAGQSLVIPGVNAHGGVEDLGVIQPVVSGPGATITVGKQIVVDLSDSRAYAYENGVLVYNALASTGLPATPTVVGEFSVYIKYRSQTMSGPGYYLPGVEWVMYFYQGYGLHGTYWHNNFGQPMSHGCVNLANSDAQWFYNWAEVGTPVRVQY
ncbi:MAG: LysM peptidoglycan-binding domain-containing protein [bacterium]|nr:LysM peptidoglycan-binding domain-containing protein [bacterium]